MQPKAKRDVVLQKSIANATSGKSPATANAGDSTTPAFTNVCDGKPPTVASAGEQIAEQWLTKRGYKIIERNWRSGRFGEIDLIATAPNGLLTFVEVKTRRAYSSAEHQRTQSDDDESPMQLACSQALESINWQKRRKILIATRSYLARKRICDSSCQIDAIIITYTSACIRDGQRLLKGLNLLHIPAAFSEI